MPYCPYCGTSCETLSGLSKHISQRVACALALSKDPEKSKKRAAAAKSQPFTYEVGDNHNLDIAFLGDDDDDVLHSPSKYPRKATGDIAQLKKYLANIDQTVARQLVDDLLFNQSDFVDVGEEFTLIEDIELLNIGQDPPNEVIEEEDTIGSFDGIDDDAFILGTRFDLEDDLDNPFRDVLRGKFTPEETLSINLLRLMRAIQAPTYAYKKVMKLIQDATHQNITITSTFSTRKAALAFLTKRFKLSSLLPQVHTKIGTDQRAYPCVVHDARAMIESLLYSELAQDDRNLLFSNPDNPLAPPPAIISHLADIDTGRVYRRAYQETCTGPKDILCGIVAYIDKLAIDKHGHLSLEPIYFTLSIFNRATRNKPEAWRPLGYIPNLHLMSAAEVKHCMSPVDRLQLYHDIIADIFQSLVQLQESDGIPYKFKYRGVNYDVNCKVPLLVVLGDTEGHDKLSGRYGSRIATQKICRHCDIPRIECDDVNYPWQHTYPSTVQEAIATGEKTALQAISYHNLRNAFWNIQNGNNLRNIHGMTPGEPLHAIELGLMKYAIRGFSIALGLNPDSDGSAPILFRVIERYARKIGRRLSHQSDRSLPRTYFPTGVTSGTKLAAHEMPGVCLVMLIMCKMESTRVLITKKLGGCTDRRLLRWVKLFELILSWRWWLKKENIPKEEVDLSITAIKKLHLFFKSVVNRQDGQGMKIIKFHLSMHIPENIMDFGVTANIDTGPAESNHKKNAKQPSRLTQMRAETFEVATARRYFENVVMDFAGASLDKGCAVANQPKRSIVRQNPNLRGSRYSVCLDILEGQQHPNIVATWDKRTANVKHYPERYMHWLGRNVLQLLGIEHSTIEGCTEHKRNDIIFRGHPAYRGNSSWYDWALFQWASPDDDNDGQDLYVPGHIITFLDLTQAHLDKLVESELVIGDVPGVYALIESLEEELPAPIENDRIVTIAGKTLTKEQRRQRRHEGRDCRLTNILLVTAECIYEPLSAIPNFGGERGEYIFIRSPETWADRFTEYIGDP